jgi:RHS repeat-associated protein
MHVGDVHKRGLVFLAIIMAVLACILAAEGKVSKDKMPTTDSTLQNAAFPDTKDVLLPPLATPNMTAPDNTSDGQPTKDSIQTELKASDDITKASGRQLLPASDETARQPTETAPNTKEEPITEDIITGAVILPEEMTAISDDNLTEAITTEIDETEINITEINDTEINESDLNTTVINETEMNITEINETELNMTEINETVINITENITENITLIVNITENITVNITENMTNQTPLRSGDHQSINIIVNGRIMATLTGSQTVYYLDDTIGSVQKTLNDKGEITSRSTFYPYGKILSRNSLSTGDPAYGFAGKEEDGSLSYFGARYLISSIGQFASTDPIMHGSQTSYSYADDNPLRLVDPTGKDAEPTAFPGPYASDSPQMISYQADLLTYQAQHGQAQDFRRTQAQLGDTLGVTLPRVIGHLDNPSLVSDLQEASSLSGISEPMIFATAAQEGGAAFVRNYQSDSLITTRAIGMDSYWADRPRLEDQGIPTSSDSVGTWTNEGGMPSTVTRLSMRQALLGTAGMLAMRREALNEHTDRYGITLNPLETNYYNYVYYNVGTGFRNPTGRLAGQGILRTGGINSVYANTRAQTDRVNINAGHVAGNAALIDHLGWFAPQTPQP